MNKKIFENARFTPKGDIEANWKKAVGFIPLDKEIIIYKPDESHSYSRMKIGDGVTGINDLPFVGDENVLELPDNIATQEWVGEQVINLSNELIQHIDSSVQGLASEDYVNEQISAIPSQVQVDYEQSNETAKDYIKNRPFYIDKPIIIDESSFEALRTDYSFYDKNGDTIHKDYWSSFSKNKNLDLDSICVIGKKAMRNGMSIDRIDFEMTGKDAFDQGIIQWVTCLSDHRYDCWACLFQTLATSGDQRVTSIVYENVKQLDEKFIPNTIARTTEIADLMNTINEQRSELNNKNTKQDDKIAELEGKITIATFNIIEDTNNTVTLQNLEGMTKIDWGDGIVNNDLTHTYEMTGEYVCKIYDCVNIGSHTFDGCVNLTSITLGNDITSIGDWAFNNCPSLTSIKIPDSLKTIGVFAFVNSKVKDIYITSLEAWCNISFYDPASVPQSSTGANLYLNNVCITKLIIPSTVTTIKKHSFQNFSQLTKVIIPDSVTSINACAFMGCSNLTSITIPNSVTSIGSKSYSADGVFKNCDKLEEVTIPFIGIDKDVTGAFGVFGAIFGYTLGQQPGTVAQYYNSDSNQWYYYYIPESLKKVVITGGNEIKSNSFHNCSSLTSVVIPDSVTSIGYRAFYNCSSLTNILIPDCVTSIDLCAFEKCDNLTNIKFHCATPVTYTKSWFNNCDSLATIYVPYGCAEAYKTKWAMDGAEQDILDLIVESDREAYMSDIKSLKTEIQEQLVGKTDYLGTITGMADLSVIAGAGDYHRVSTEFVYDATTGEKAHIGDVLVAVIDLVGLENTQTAEYWDLIHTNTNIDNVVDLTSDQEIGGLKTFTAPIKIKTETEGDQIKIETVATQEWVIEYIKNNFATLMAQYLNTEGAATNKPTEADISTIFNEDEEA